MPRIECITGVQYDKRHERCVLDVFRPGDDQRAPLVALIHGGGWVGGEPSQYHQTCIQLAARGFAAASIGYRLMGEAQWPDIAHDLLRGLEYLKREAHSVFGIDASRAVTLGSSAGGHLALVLQAKAAQWAADGVVSDAPEIVGTVGQCPATILPDPGNDEKMRKFASGHPRDEFSPGHMETKLFKSVLIVHGDADEVIPLERSRRFITRLSSAGVDAELHVLLGVGHAFGYRLNHAPGKEAFKVTLPYLERILK